ncbi:uncharacterized protein YjiS (DUF1127 family) [Pantoea ananatis]|uniref:DUF1127 domain-containing protein n=1 Tax=Pantoea ananas TaxID=553 RepID=UPI000DC27B72|nr:DUF1127 domain-containing protein [Pantoea ananatis]RAR65564.1 uncharacterized protein YjiS (DUF1127 family) [Pantoea ananatis]
MGYEENRAAKPLVIRPFRFLRIVWGNIRRWQCQRETRAILSRLSDCQLKDIGLNRRDIH